jgi:hypothetical protein
MNTLASLNSAMGAEPGMDMEHAIRLAAYVEGEGCLFIKARHRVRPARGPRYHQPTMEVNNTALELVEKCREIAGGSIYGPTPGGGRCKPSYRWRLVGIRLPIVLNAILPHLVIKREQALILLELCRLIRPHGSRRSVPASEREWREQMGLAIHALNHRGSTPVPSGELEALALVRAYLGIAAPDDIEFALPLPDLSPQLSLFGAWA